MDFSIKNAILFGENQFSWAAQQAGHLAGAGFGFSAKPKSIFH